MRKKDLQVGRAYVTENGYPVNGLKVVVTEIPPKGANVRVVTAATPGHSPSRAGVELKVRTALIACEWTEEIERAKAARFAERVATGERLAALEDRTNAIVELTGLGESNKVKVHSVCRVSVPDGLLTTLLDAAERVYGRKPNEEYDVPHSFAPAGRFYPDEQIKALIAAAEKVDAHGWLSEDEDQEELLGRALGLKPEGEAAAAEREPEAERGLAGATPEEVWPV